MEGYVKIYRSIMKWEWHDSPNTGWLFVMLLLMASHEDTRYRGQAIRRGQLVTSLQKLSKATGISVRSIRTGLERLKESHEIDTKPTQRYSIITICNYDKYQCDEKIADTKPTQNRHATDTASNKNVNNNIISSSSARVRVDDIQKYMDGLDGTSQLESVKRELYRLTGSIPDAEAMASLVGRWIDELKIQGEEEKDETDICRHFISWARIAIPADAGKKNRKVNNTRQNDNERYFLKLPDKFKPLM